MIDYVYILLPTAILTLAFIYAILYGPMGEKLKRLPPVAR